MRKFMIVLALAAFTSAFAQENKNKKKETVVTKTTVTDAKGTQTSSKSISNTTKQVIGLDKSESNKVNQNIVMQPMEVDTEVSYGFDGNRFQFINQKDEDGYRLMTVRDNAQNEDYAIIKPSTQNGYYILAKDGQSSFGYFNDDGNFVVERYDPNTDTVVSDIYRLEMKQNQLLQDKK